jgi:anaerobic magnesium-protoporphyrin IX monomethyl ester cyclase
MPAHQIKRVLLLSLPAIMERGAPENDFNVAHTFNLGLAYLAGILRKNKFDVEILDCLVENPHNLRSIENEWCEIGVSDEHILETIARFDPHLVGMAIPFSYQHDMAMKIARKIKLAFPKILIVAGGNHVAAVPEKIDRSYVDYLIIGEGELALLQLIRALNQGGAADEIPGVASQKTSKFQHAPFIEDLDRLPFPAIDLLPLQKLWGNRRRWINMVASRGCVFDCVFCSIHTITGYIIRRRSVENVIAEIRHWHKLYKIQEIYFEDDNITANKKWAKELFRQIIQNAALLLANNTFNE